MFCDDKFFEEIVSCPCVEFVNKLIERAYSCEFNFTSFFNGFHYAFECSMPFIKY